MKRQSIRMGDMLLSEVLGRLAPFAQKAFAKANSKQQLEHWLLRDQANHAIAEALRNGEIKAHVRDDASSEEFRIAPADWYGLLHSEIGECISTSVIRTGDTSALFRHKGMTVYVREEDAQRWLESRRKGPTARPNGKRGPRPARREAVKQAMRDFGDMNELANMKLSVMETMFAASADTCTKAREEVLSEFRGE